MWRRLRRIWTIHFYVTGSAYPVMEEFAQAYEQKRAELAANGHVLPELEEYGWLVEEFRVQTFAPELRTAVPVSPQRLQDVWVIVSR